MKKSFMIVVSDGEYTRIRADDRYEYEGHVYGTLGGWSNSSEEFIGPKMYDTYYTDLLFDPTRLTAMKKEDALKRTIKFIFEDFNNR